MKTSRKDAVVKKLWTATKLLNDAVISINKIRDKGHQFDYVSDPKLSDVIDRINNLSKALNNIVYQKN